MTELLADSKQRKQEELRMLEEYNGDWWIFEGKLLDLATIRTFPNCLEKTHLLQVREMLEGEGFNPDDYRVGELPTEGVYYFEKAVDKLGIDYFSLYVNEKGTLIPQYTTKELDKNGFNTFDCKTIKESIELHEC